MKSHSIENEKIILQTEDSLELEFVIPSECDFFDGHFPQFKLLPAVAQLEIATRFASKYFEIKPFIKKAKRLKFLMPLLPDSKVTLKLNINREKKNVSFTFFKNEKDSYSTGAYFYE